ncbi:DUF6542 domain-containing protein [Saccharomonospora azurea]|uniref:DUF6542 domain-containing protein n=1 Tax=Saccharomonospora azurea TaxID=40988 RepID=UPI00023FEAF6|nr:DUF6542 domain-containing protein [Saccharomonospora azurea]EHK82851.1 hypothetical protein SZMC14600_20069 [Saccharomonospora azurea SZMC 14600]
MTAIRDRRSAAESAETETAAFPWDERSVLNSRRGIPWWSAALLTFGLALVGAFVDQFMTDSLSVVFHVCYVVGALGAITAVQRKSLFGPMVQPPLAMALAVPLVVLTASGLPEGSDMLSKGLAIGTPLIESFPMMAGTTAATVLIGILRMVKQRGPGAAEESEADSKSAKSAKSATSKASEKAAVRDDEAEPDDKTRPVIGLPAKTAERDENRPRRRAPGAPSDAPPPAERRSRPRRDAAAPPPRKRPRADADAPRPPRDDAPPARRRPGPPPDQPDKRQRGEGRPQPPAGRGRRVPPPPRGDEPSRGEPPPRGRQPGRPRRGVPRSDPRGGGPRRGNPRGDNPPRRGRPWDDERP